MDVNAKKILIIDDQPDFREMIALRLQTYGFLVETADNGKEGLEKIHRQPPDAVITDVHMPEMDGFTLLKELKRLCRGGLVGNRFIPIVVITGVKKGPEMKALFEMEGVSAFFEKPVDGKRLAEKVKELVSN